MKRFEFKLEALLKIREIKEKQLKAKLGEILKEINQVKQDTEKNNLAITDAYLSQERLIENVAGAKMLEFYPFYIQGLKAKIEHNNNLVFALNKKYEEKVQELKIAMGEVKVVESFKEKEKIKHKKHEEKKLMETIEELMQMRRGQAGSSENETDI